VGIAARTSADQMMLEMLRAASTEASIEVVPGEMTADQALQRVLQKRPAAVCVVALSPTRGSEVRNYCRRLRAELPECRVIVVRPTLADADPSKSTMRMKHAGADYVASSAQEALEAIADALGVEAPAPVAEQRAVVA
jgi:DNA-binding NarL/FixJ family response regulator